MAKIGPRIGATVVVIGFNTYLAKGHLEWVPDWVPIGLCVVGGLYWISYSEEVQSFVKGALYRGSSNVYDYRGERITREGIHKGKAIALALVALTVSALIGGAFWYFRSASGRLQSASRWEAKIDFILPDAMPALYQRKGTAVLIGAEIINHGAPSVLGRWRLRVQIPNTEQFELEPEVLPGPINLAPSGGKKYVVDHSNTLYEKVSTNPIPTGGRQDGVLWFLANNVEPADMRRPGTKYTLTFIDADSRPGSAEYTLTAASSPTYTYIPGEMTQE